MRTLINKTKLCLSVEKVKSAAGLGKKGRGINSIIEFGAQPCLKVLMWTLSNSKIYVLESFSYLQESEGLF